MLISCASAAGFETNWTDPCSIKLLTKNVDLREGEDRDYSWAMKNISGFARCEECRECNGEGAYKLVNNTFIECEICQGEGHIWVKGEL